MHFEILGQERKDKKPFNPCLLRHKDKHLVIVSGILLWLKLLLTFVKISRRCFFVSIRLINKKNSWKIDDITEISVISS